MGNRGIGPHAEKIAVRALLRACYLAAGACWLACSPSQSVDRDVVLADAGPGATDVAAAGTPAAVPPAPAAPSTPAAPVGPPPNCGDGRADPGEDCDLGRLNELDPYGPGKCSLVCKLAASCGDGTRNGPEECDEGPKNLESAGPYGVEGQCNVLCRRITQFCGDGQLTAPETCDRGLENSADAYGKDLCTQTCAPAPFCGDGLPSVREECDLGPANTLDGKIWSPSGGGCNQVCKSIVKRCGDGLTDAPDEQCDAGSMNTMDDSIYGTRGGCNRRCKRVGFCGDGIKDVPEHCDLGARNTGDDKLWGFTAGGCTRSCLIITRFCGDGFVEGAPDEQCDLGPGRNTGARGGCDARCRTVPP